MEMAGAEFQMEQGQDCRQPGCQGHVAQGQSGASSACPWAYRPGIHAGPVRIAVGSARSVFSGRSRRGRR